MQFKKSNYTFLLDEQKQQFLITFSGFIEIMALFKTCLNSRKLTGL